MKLMLWIAGGALALLAGGVTLAYLNPVPALLLAARLRKPKVIPNRPVGWDHGPAMPAAPAGERPPNVVLIVADDVGYNGVSLHGGGLVPTPNIDGIARDGVECLNGYAGDATCAPSRAALLTGRYATRFGFEFTPVPPAHARLISLAARGRAGMTYPVLIDRAAQENVPAIDNQAIPPSEITVADLLHRQGYHTIHLGKWHLGASVGIRPEDKGFDESLGFMAGAALYLPKNHPDAVNAEVDFDPMEKLLWAGASWGVQYNGSPLFAQGCSVL